jgi:hypothetical protein
VAMMLVLLDANAGFSVRQDVVKELARLGVASVAVVRDSESIGVVLEGWLFDPARSAGAAASAIGRTGRARVLHPVLQMAVSTAQSQGGRDARKASTA